MGVVKFIEGEKDFIVKVFPNQQMQKEVYEKVLSKVISEVKE